MWINAGDPSKAREKGLRWVHRTHRCTQRPGPGTERALAGHPPKEQANESMQTSKKLRYTDPNQLQRSEEFQNE